MSMLGDTWFVIIFSVLLALTLEGLTWYLVYRTPEYQRLTRQLERSHKELEKQQAAAPPATAAARVKNEKRLAVLNKDYQTHLRDFTMSTFKVKMMAPLASFAGLWILSSKFAGVVVAKAPFVPFGIFQKLSHRGLEGDDPTDLSALFIYSLCHMAVRANITKLMGFAEVKGVAKTPGLFDIPTEDRDS